MARAEGGGQADSTKARPESERVRRSMGSSAVALAALDPQHFATMVLGVVRARAKFCSARSMRPCAVSGVTSHVPLQDARRPPVHRGSTGPASGRRRDPRPAPRGPACPGTGAWQKFVDGIRTILMINTRSLLDTPVDAKSQAVGTVQTPLQHTTDNTHCTPPDLPRLVTIRQPAGVPSASTASPARRARMVTTRSPGGSDIICSTALLASVCMLGPLDSAHYPRRGVGRGTAMHA